MKVGQGLHGRGVRAGCESRVVVEQGLVLGPELVVGPVLVVGPSTE